MNNITIRPATPSDFDAIYTFVCGLEDEVFDKEEMKRCFDHCLKQENHHYLIAFNGANPVGYISCHGQLLMHHCGLVYEIQELYVVPEQRRNGLGKLLVAALVQTVSGTDYRLMEVTSNEKRVAAHQFYLNNGFEKTSFKFKRCI
jgi:(aminoalkyl)phosphonate N-acetyltransferase